MKTIKYYVTILVCLLLHTSHRLDAQDLITNVYGRDTFSLNGEWQYIMDPYETGFYDHRRSAGRC